MEKESERRPRGRPALGKETDRPALGRERIVAAALDLVDREGMGGLTMRKLGAALGADAKAVYHYLPGKTALTDLLFEALMGSIRLPEDFDLLSAREALEIAALAYARALLAHPKALPAAVSRPLATAGSLVFIERVLARLLAAGAEPRRALDALNLVGNYIRGSLQMWIPHAVGSPEHDHGPMDPLAADPGRFPALGRVISETGTEYEPERTFRLGLGILLDALAPSEAGRGALDEDSAAPV